ncbi:M48 family metalloprotease [Qipengyuania sp. JC766]|uniref:M48 family metalloprotease n=1 Tax=Qipengyuania sp. JC766 TaxID=3232139 RepID=UPI0034594625
MRILAQFVAMLAALSLLVQPAHAQSVLRDAETEALLRDMAAPLVEAAELEEGNVDLVLIDDRSINAFVAGGQAVYIHTGLIEAADTANEVQGVIAHELGHVKGGHVIRHSEGVAQASKISILSLLLGVGAALAGAPPEAAAGVLQAGQRAALGRYLAFSRVQESSADAAGAEYLSKAGISGRGSIEFFKKLRNLEYRYGYTQRDSDEFARTHPLSGNRISRLQATYQEDPAWDAPNDPALQARFERVKAKLYGYQADPERVLVAYPESRTDVPARYARAYAWHREARVDKALAEADALLAQDPDDPYFLELKGQILLESGRVAEALDPLRQATEMTAYEPLIASMFGHALIATEDASHHEEAEQVLRSAVARDRRNPFAWYQLGVVYAQRGDMPRARLASAEQQVMTQQYTRALESAQFAMAGLPENSVDWIRAQDIAFQARAELERIRERR